MQEYCPLCTRNGIKIEIKAFQINEEEAVFMCSSEKCTWPIGHEELYFFNRPIGKNWSHTWDDTARKHHLNSISRNNSESDMLLEFSSYTPPQTPGTEIKDLVVGTTCYNTAGSVIPTVTDDNNRIIFNSLPTTLLDDNNVREQDEFSLVISNVSIVTGNNNNNNSNNVNLKPKLVISKPVNNKLLDKLPVKGGLRVTKNSEYTNGMFIKNTDRHFIRNIKKEVTMKSSTSLTNNSVFVKNPNFRNSSFTTVKTDNKDKPRVGLKVLNRKKSKANKSIPYAKFNFDELIKNKSTNIKKEKNLDFNPKNNNVKTEVIKPKEYLNLKKEVVDIKEEASSLDKFDFDMLMNPYSTNVKSECNDLNSVGSSIVNSSSSSTQSDYDSLLALTSSSKESEMDQNLLDNDDFLQLDDILAGFSDDIDTTLESNADNTDDNKWIKSLFE